MIVEDSRVVRALLEHVIESDGRFEIVASVESAEDGLARLERVRPDVISLDIRLPGMSGFEFTRRVMAERPTPIVVVSASVEKEELNIAMNALRAGAVVVLEKPVSPTSEAYEALAGRVCEQLALMSDLRVIRQRSARRREEAVGDRPVPARPPAGGYRALGIVASTGGPNALVEVLRGLGGDFPLPVLVVQHITAAFLTGFVTWLDRMVPMPVVEARHGEPCRGGVAHVAVPDRHLEVRSGRLQLVDGEAGDYQPPSGTVLLRSLAREYGRRAAGIVLTGMGRDGAAGLKAIRDAGGLALAEHESTCVIYGMPAAARDLGAAQEFLPLPEIAPHVRKATLNDVPEVE